MSSSTLKCRTCFEAVADFYSLKDPFENQSLGDLLHFITKINKNGKDAERRLPQHLCGNCAGKLKNAYGFAQQAQRVNEQLLKMLATEAICTATTSTSIAAQKAAQLLELVDPLNEMNAQIKVEEEAVVGDECLFDAADVVMHPGGGGDRIKRLRVGIGGPIANRSAQKTTKLQGEQDFNKGKDHTPLDLINISAAHWPPDDDNDDSFLMEQNNDSDSQDSIELESLVQHQCRLCHRSHALRYCKGFIAMKPSQRDDVVRAHGYCRNCLALSHSTGFCNSEHTCQRCQLKHHTMLHPEEETVTVGQAPAPRGPNKSARKRSHHQSDNSRSNAQPSRITQRHRQQSRSPSRSRSPHEWNRSRNTQQQSGSRSSHEPNPDQQIWRSRSSHARNRSRSPRQHADRYELLSEWPDEEDVRHGHQVKYARVHRGPGWLTHSQN